MAGDGIKNDNELILKRINTNSVKFYVSSEIVF